MLGDVHTGGFDWFGVLYLAVILAVIFMPVLLARRSASPPSDGGPDDDRGGGPRAPLVPPKAPLGGPPLADADQSRNRLRDHGRQPGRAPTRRRPVPHLPRRHTRTPVG